MKMLLHFLICRFNLILFLAFNSLIIISNAQTTDNPYERKIPSEPTVFKTTRIEINLSKKILTKACLENKQCEHFCPSDGQITKVSVLAKNIKDENLTYKYTVSGGNVIGQGSNVIWDFTDTNPGYYTIEVEATNGKNIRFKSENKKITLIRCVVSDSINEPPCIAPVINVKTPSDFVKEGETIEFTADVSGGSQKAVAYNWSIQSKKGRITDQQTNWRQSEISFEGQSTSTIKIKTTAANADETLVATVEILGLCSTGPKTASAAVYVDKSNN